jgi:hypothetical protein
MASGDVAARRRRRPFFILGMIVGMQVFLHSSHGGGSLGSISPVSRIRTGDGVLADAVLADAALADGVLADGVLAGTGASAGPGSSRAFFGVGSSG